MSENVAKDLKGFPDGLYIIQDGQVTPMTPKPFGQDTIIWQNGQVLDVERTERIRIKKAK